MARRTTHRSSRGVKLYAVRSKDGKFKDIQTFKRAHAADMRRKSKDELAAAELKTANKAEKKKATKTAAPPKKAAKPKAATKPAKKPSAKRVIAAKPVAKKAAPKPLKKALAPKTIAKKKPAKRR